MCLKNLKRFCVGLVCLGMLSGMTTVSAETQTVNYDSTINTTPTITQEVGVEVEKAEIYAVTLPKNVQLDGSLDSPTYQYTVEVSGEISTDNFVRVIPLEGSFIQTDMGVTHDLSVTQEKIKWTADEVLTGSTVNGTMTAIDLNPGKYTGYVRFFVSLDDGYFYQEATCTTGKLRIGEDTNNNGVMDTGEELGTPVQVGKPLGHSHSGAHTFESVCDRCHKTVYEVSTPEELVEFSAAVNAGNSFAGKTVLLTKDLDMYDLTSVTPFTPIGKPSALFAGTFDGCNHTIKNIDKLCAITGLTVTNLNISAGFFGAAGNGAEIKNLILADSDVAITTVGATPYIATAGLCAYTTGGLSITNCRLTNYNLTHKVATNTSDGFASPFVGTTPDAVNNTICITNSCATNFSVLYDFTDRASGVYIKCNRALGYAEYRQPITMRNSYVIIDVFANAPGGITSKTTNTLYSSFRGGSASQILANLPYTYASTDTTTATNCIALTDEELKSQTGIDLLNTGYSTPVWKLDLLNENNGYPIQII